WSLLTDGPAERAAGAQAHKLLLDHQQGVAGTGNPPLLLRSERDTRRRGTRTSPWANRSTTRRRARAGASAGAHGPGASGRGTRPIAARSLRRARRCTGSFRPRTGRRTG